MMRRILNLNSSGAKLAAISGLFLFLLPAVLFLGSLLLEVLRVPNGLIAGLITASIAFGMALAAVLVILVVVEQIQDHVIDVEYQNHRHRKVKLSDGYYECQYCGNRKLPETARVCPVCGHRLA